MQEMEERIIGYLIDIKADIVDVKGTVNALADALLETSREVKQMKVKR